MYRCCSYTASALGMGEEQAIKACMRWLYFRVDCVKDHIKVFHEISFEIVWVRRSSLIFLALRLRDTPLLWLRAFHYFVPAGYKA